MLYKLLEGMKVLHQNKTKKKHNIKLNTYIYTINNYGTANSIYRVHIVKISPTFAMYPNYN